MTGASWPEPAPRREIPEIPYPYPPLRPTPRRDGELRVPLVDLPTDDGPPDALERRVVLRASLDAETATRLAAELMALDGRSPAPVSLHITSDGGSLVDVLAVVDVVRSMRAPVDALCIGRAKGTAAVLLACATGDRRAAPNALVSLRCGYPERLEGSTDQLRGRLAELDLIRSRVVSVLTTATGQSSPRIAEELERGEPLTPEAARELGVIDAIGWPPRPQGSDVDTTTS